MDGGAGIDELVRAAKYAYLRAARDTVLPHDRRVNVSRLSVATGMTRKEVSALLNSPMGTQQDRSKRSGEQRALRVLRGWLTDPRFQNRNGYPDLLSYRGPKKSFVILVKLYGGDVTPKSVLRELERMNIVGTTQSGALRVRARGKRNNVETRYYLAELARLFEDFVSAIVRPGSAVEAPPFFGFRDSTVPSLGDAASFVRTFSRRAAALLEDFSQWSAGRHGPKLKPHPANEGARIGLGVYLLRSNHSPATKSPARAVERAPIRRPQSRRK